MAKRILKDPHLSQLASRKFHEAISKNTDNKFLCENSILHDLLDQQEEER